MVAAIVKYILPCTVIAENFRPLWTQRTYIKANMKLGFIQCRCHVLELRTIFVLQIVVFWVVAPRNPAGICRGDRGSMSLLNLVTAAGQQGGSSEGHDINSCLREIFKSLIYVVLTLIACRTMFYENGSVGLESYSPRHTETKSFLSL